MNRYRGTTVLLVALFTLALLGVALYAFTPRRAGADIDTQVVHTMVAALDGLLQRCGVSPHSTRTALQATPWDWVGGLAAAVAIAASCTRRRPHR